MKKILILAILFHVVNGIAAQTTEDSVKMAVNKMFTAMKSADTTALRSVLADGALLQTITRDREGRSVVRNEPFASFLDFISKQKSGDADERIRFDMIKIDGPLASVWTPYQFYYKGQFSHCGVNSFQLVRLNNGWKIQYIIDTRRREGCE